MIQQSEFLKPIDFDEQFFAVDQLSILCPDGTYQSDCTGHEGVLSKRQEFINKVWCQYYNNPPYINIGSPIYDGKDFNFFSKAENVTDYEFAVAKQYCDEQNQKKPEFLKPIDFDEQFFAIDPISPIDEFVYLGEVSYFGERLCPDGTMQPYKSSSEQSDCIGHEAPSDKMHQKMYQTYDPIYIPTSGVAIEELGGIQANYNELQLQKLKLELMALKNPITSEVTPMAKIAPQEVNTPIVPMSDSIDTKSLGIALGLGLVVWFLLSNKKD